MSEENKVEVSAFYGVKSGMTRIFDKEGNHVPVTVVKLVPNVISQIKTQEKDGYEACQLAYGEKREKLVNKPIKGHLAKAGVKENLTRFAEVRAEGVTEEVLGKAVTYDNFSADSYVDVTGTSKGKGFQGVMKRYGFAGGPASHGSHFHRTPGSIGNRATPGRVFKQKKLPGHMGVKTRTVQNLKIVDVNLEKGFMLIKGSLPGSKNSFIKISKSVKRA